MLTALFHKFRELIIIMDQIVDVSIHRASERLCSEKLLKVSIAITCFATLLFTLAFGYMGLAHLVVTDLTISALSVVCWVHLSVYHHPKWVARVLAMAIYTGLMVQIRQSPEYMVELGMSLPFIVIILTAAGAFVEALCALVIIIATIGVLSGAVDVAGSGVSWWQVYARMDVFSLSSFVIAFGMGGMLFTYHFFQMHRQIYKASFVDIVSGLPNRALLEQRLEHYFLGYQQKQARFHVLFADAEHFTHINNLFGHDVGDNVLRQIGQRLWKACGELSHVGASPPIEVFRFGGDEFVMTIPYYLTDAELQRLVVTLLSRVGSSYRVGDYELDVRLIIGLSTSGKSAKNAKDLLRFADIAMYSAKRSERQQALYHENEVTDWDRHFIIHQHLNKAVELDEFRLVFQPVYEIPSQRLLGCEVLIRWNSKVLGPVPPDEFIAVAEVSGLINSIGLMVFERSLEVIRSLQALSNGALKVAVNVSPYQLKNRHFYDRAVHLLANNPELVEALELEVTESAAFVNSEHVTQLLRGFKAMGLRLALDDYGTGSTSFMSLQQGAFSRLKLDKRLLYEAMADHTKYLVIKAAIDSAHSLGLEITAEGIETPSQYQMVLALGCTAVQGYLFSCPLSLEDFTALFQQKNNALMGHVAQH
ncbi:putative bifunctional diguanylate cyclase/phosphodiesterase [Thiothrix lacustris]|uniref:GGDEF and EAL domain-containing protein n=1 Tax=Thiothrix lacustris TaxID=525917 RepID=A0ABY9MQY2_9GAMM|nr:GGDEF and EAL domain-containing protein [Thiothrix lacustris]WML91054.1 GGDEF and EAL domain-containing protein [Thiothrix lacustris]WMP17055.1 GGDEF and EAL domain-containing protein [Thiothrix lacustris]